jgi:uncharacterized protein (TIGR00730 family)
MGSQVTVFGSSRVVPEEGAYHDALRLGRLLAEAGYAVCSGGYSGVMEAVSRGAAEAGGTVVGVTVELWSSRMRANAWLTREIAAPHLFERMYRLIASDAYVALPGGPGTLGEVAVTWNLFQTASVPVRPLILVGEPWRRVMECLVTGIHVEAQDLALLRFVDGVDDVVPLLRELSDL